MASVRAHTRKHLSGEKHQCGVGLRPSSVRISRRNEMKRPTKNNCQAVDVGVVQRTTAGMVGRTGRE